MFVDFLSGERDLAPTQASEREQGPVHFSMAHSHISLSGVLCAAERSAKTHRRRFGADMWNIVER